MREKWNTAGSHRDERAGGRVWVVLGTFVWSLLGFGAVTTDCDACDWFNMPMIYAEEFHREFPFQAERAYGCWGSFDPYEFVGPAFVPLEDTGEIARESRRGETTAPAEGTDSMSMTESMTESRGRSDRSRSMTERQTAAEWASDVGASDAGGSNAGGRGSRDSRAWHGSDDAGPLDPETGALVN